MDKEYFREIISRNRETSQGEPYSMEEIHAMADRIKTGMPDAQVFLVGPYAWGWGQRNHTIGLAIALPDHVLRGTPTGAIEGEALRLAAPGEMPVEISAYPASIVEAAPADILGMRNIQL